MGPFQTQHKSCNSDRENGNLLRLTCDIWGPPSRAPHKIDLGVDMRKKANDMSQGTPKFELK